MSNRQDKRPGESLESLLKRFKRRVKNDGTLLEYKSRERFEKPSEKRKRELKSAKQRTKQAQRFSEI